MNTKIKPLSLRDSGLSEKNYQLLKKLYSPQKNQDYLDSSRFNFEKEVETSTSVSVTLDTKVAHCFEGALVAAAAFWINGHKPLLLDLRATAEDLDHVVTLFNIDGFWGSISKTNHGVLGYREPVYKSVRELVMSYFHEYFLFNGKKTLRSYSEPFDLSKQKINWLTSPKNLFDLTRVLDKSPHTNILSKKQIKNLRLAQPTEIKMGEITDWKS